MSLFYISRNSLSHAFSQYCTKLTIGNEAILVRKVAGNDNVVASLAKRRFWSTLEVLKQAVSSL